MIINREQIDAIKARTNAATKGPWSVYSTIQAESVVVGASGRLTATIATPSTAPEDYGFANAEFIAHARTDVPALIDTARAYHDTCDLILKRCSEVGPTSEWDALELRDDILKIIGREG